MARPKKPQIPVYNAEIGTSGRKWLEVIQQGGDEVQRRRAGQILELLAAGDADTAVYLAIMLGQRDGLQGFFHGLNRKLYHAAAMRWWKQKTNATAKGMSTRERVHQLWQGLSSSDRGNPKVAYHIIAEKMGIKPDTVRKHLSKPRPRGIH